MPRHTSLDEVCAILASDANVATTAFLFHPRALSADLSGMSRTIDTVTLQERADWSFYESTHITFDNMRFGRPPEEVSEEASDFLRFNSGIFQEEVWLLGDALGASLDEVTSEVELVTARSPSRENRRCERTS